MRRRMSWVSRWTPVGVFQFHVPRPIKAQSSFKFLLCGVTESWCGLGGIKSRDADGSLYWNRVHSDVFFFSPPQGHPQNLLRTTWKSQRETTLCGFILFPQAAEIRRVCLERQRKRLRLVSYATFSLPHFSQSCLPSCLRYPNTNSPKKWHSKQILGSNPGKTSEMPDEFLWQVTYMWDFLTVPSLHKVLLLI